MGDIDLLYHRSFDLSGPLMAGDYWVDIGENIHLHLRDLRIEFTRGEFLEFLSHTAELKQLFEEWSSANPGWKEAQDPEAFNNKFVVWLGGYKPGSHKLKKAEAFYWPRRLSLERNRNGTYHFHYRNLRVELTKADFQRLCKAFEGLEAFERRHAEQARSEFLRRHFAKEGAAPKFRGYLDDVQGLRVWGWVQAVDDPRIPWEVALVANGRVVARVLADHYRPDLEEKFGYGKSGFEALLSGVEQRALKELKAFVLPLNIELSRGSPPASAERARPYLILQDPASLPIDPLFFNRFVKGKRLSRVECLEVPLEGLKVHLYTPQGSRIAPIRESPAYRYLCGDQDSYHSYRQYENPLNQHSAEEHLELVRSLTENGYDTTCLLVMFDNDNIIRDGQHRAAILLHQGKLKKIPVLNICFCDKDGQEMVRE